MKFIELTQIELRSDGYRSKYIYPIGKVMVRIANINSVEEFEKDYECKNDFCKITMSNSETFMVKENYVDIISQIEQ